MNRIIFTMLCLISILSGAKAQDLVLSDTQTITFNANYKQTTSFYHADMAFDSKGNKILVGSFDGTYVYFDADNAISSYQSNNVFIAKYDTAGKISWLKNIGGNTSEVGWNGYDAYSMDEAIAVKLDTDDNIYVLGKCNVSTNEILDFDSSHPETDSKEEFSTKVTEIFLTKYSPDGKLVWKRILGDSFDDSAFNLLIDAEGNVWITGFIEGFTANVLDFDPENEHEHDKDKLQGQFAHMGFMACYDMNGGFKLVKGTGESGLFSNIGIGVSETGNVYMAGTFSGSTSLFLNDSTPHIIKNKGRSDLYIVDPDIFILKYNSSDSIEWIKTIGSTSYNEINSIVVDADENIYLTGYFTGTNVDFDIDNNHAYDLQTSVSSGSAYVSKYDKDGELLWVNVVKGGTSSKGRDLLLVDTILVATGEVKGSNAYFGDVTLSSLASNSNGYLALMTTNGNWIDAIAFESNKFSSVIDAEIGSDGMLCAVGFNGTIYDGQVDAEELSILSIRSATIDSKLVNLVEFKDWDGTVLKEQSVLEGEAATPPANPTREGFTFVGWSANFDSVTADLEVTALYCDVEKVWHQVPNGDFESWTLYPEGISGGGDFYMPVSADGTEGGLYNAVGNGWWHENLRNIATRFYSSAGYFNRYEEDDANGYALKLKGSGQSANGFIRFRCDEVPISLKGRYKFSNTGCDDFTIYAYAINSTDTLPISQLYEGTVHSLAKSFAAPITESFQDFEIDLSDFKDVDIDYFVIMFSASMNHSCTKTLPGIGDVFTNDPNGFAVVDDLELVYEVPTPEYLVVFKDWDGTVLKEQNVLEGEAATPPANPTRGGFTFTGWSVDFDSVTTDLEVAALYREVEKVWHQVPNGKFESWTLYEEEKIWTGVEWIDGAEYLLPDSGWNENAQNIITRINSGSGYFYQYEESDADGYALKLAAEGLNGFIRFRCDEVPTSLKGRYKFSDTGCDDFTIYAYAVNSADKLNNGQLFEGIVHSSAKSFVAPITESFQDFEIDLSDFKDVDIDYFVIMFKTTPNGSCVESSPIGDLLKSDSNSYAVVDDLELVYDTLASVNDELNLTDFVKVYPNPVKDLFQIEFKSLHDDTYIQLYSINGNMLSVKLVEQRLTTIDMSNYSPGVYMLQVVNGNRKEMVKILKE